MSTIVIIVIVVLGRYQCDQIGPFLDLGQLFKAFGNN